MVIFFSVIIFLIVIVFLYMRLGRFGKSPAGKRLEGIEKLSNYKNGQFQNIHHTPNLTEGYSLLEVMTEFFFKKKPGRKPVDVIPSVKTDLLNLSIDKDVLVWFGHSSYFIQIDGKKILVDPVFSGNASPIYASNKSFKGSDIYTVDDLPQIDYLFITHDHYDHLDYKTLIKLQPKVNKVICGLGVGAHLEHWNYKLAIIIEKNWNETVQLDNLFTVHTTPARHFSGRGFSRNNTLWLSFVLQTPSMKFFLGGDSGYDTHFAEIGNKYGPFDLAILENGQYDIKWRYIHLLPDEVLKAAKDLKAKKLFPVHSSKFAMANHPWKEPLNNIISLNQAEKIPLITPMIGELVNLKDDQQKFSQWWVDVI